MSLPRLLFALAVFFVVGTGALYMAFMPSASMYGVDSYPMLAVARLIAQGELPRALIWPNSTAGMDVLHWSHFLQPYVLAIGVALFDIGRAGMEVIHAIEELLTYVVALWLLWRMLPRTGVFWAAATFTLLEPGFRWVVTVIQYIRVSVLCGLAALICLFWFRTSPRHRPLAALLGGVATALAPLFFMSEGVPVALGMVVAFGVEMWLAHRRGERVVLALAAFIAGGLLPLAAIGLHILPRFGWDGVNALVASVGGYRGEVMMGRSLVRDVVSLGYFFSSVIVSPYSLTALPFGIAATAVNLVRWRALSDTDRGFTRATAICLGAWFVLALAVPTHFYAARMMWLAPLLVVQLWLLLRDRATLPGGFMVYLLAGAGLLAGQLFHRLFFAGENPLLVGVAAAVALVLAAGGAAVGRVQAVRGAPVGPAVERAMPGAGRVLLAGMVLLTFAFYAPRAVREFDTVRARFGKPPMAATVGAASRALLEKEVVAGDWVVANVPMSELVPAGVSIQALQVYRGLFTGAREEPGKLVLLFGVNTRLYPGTRTLYYRGHVYELDPPVALPEKYSLRIGRPVALSESAADINLGEVSTAQVRDYFNWRRAKGLPIN